MNPDQCRQLQPSSPMNCSHSFRTVALQHWHWSIERDKARRRRLTECDGQWPYFFLEGASSEFPAYSRCRVCHPHQTASDTTWNCGSDLWTSDNPRTSSRYATFISTYAPTLSFDDESKDHYLAMLRSTLMQVPRRDKLMYLEISMQELALILRSGEIPWANTV